MRKFWLPLLITPFILAACDSQTLGPVDASSLLDGLMKEKGGPEVKGVDATLLDSAEQAEKKRQYGRALQFFQQLYDRDKNNPRFKLGLADNLRRSGQIDEAAGYYRQILKTDSGNLDALEGKGLCLLARGEVTGASDVFDQVMKKDRNRWRSLNAVGILFVMKGMPKEASAYYAEAAKLKPGEPAILNNYGLSLALDQKYTQAVAALAEAGEGLDKGDPEKRRADLNLALVYGLSGDMERAEEVAGRHLKESALNNNLGFYAYLADNQELAKAYLNNALAGSPVFYEKAWKNLEIVGGSKVERSQLGSDRDYAAPGKRPRSKVPFEEFTRQEVAPQEAPVAAPVVPVAKTPDLPPPVIKVQPAPEPKTVAVPEKRVEKITLTPPIAANPKDSTKVEIFPALPVPPVLDDSIKPVSMVTPMAQPQLQMPQGPIQPVGPTPAFAPPPPPRTDIYLPSEMGGEKIKQQIKKDLAETPLMPEAATGKSAFPPAPVDNSHMLVFQAGESSSSAASAATPEPAPVAPEEEEPALTENPAQAGPKQPVIISGDKGGIAGEPVQEYQEPMPDRKSTVDYIKSIF